MIKSSPQFSCEFCSKSFVKETSLVSHACEKRRRWMWRDERYIKLGFMAYQKFYQLAFPGQKKKEKTYQDFMNSKYFSSFTAFGRYLLSINAIDYEGFIELLIKNSIKLDSWTDPLLYERWIRELGRKEPPERAVERNILLMQQWEVETGEPWHDFFRKVNPQLGTKWIKSGRISPWLLYSGFGEALFCRMSDEQLDLVKNVLDTSFWIKKLSENEKEVQYIRTTLKEAGV